MSINTLAVIDLRYFKSLDWLYIILKKSFLWYFKHLVYLQQSVIKKYLNFQVTKIKLNIYMSDIKIDLCLKFIFNSLLRIKVNVLFKYNLNIRFLYTLKKKIFTKLNNQVLKHTDKNIFFNKNHFFLFLLC